MTEPTKFTLPAFTPTDREYVSCVVCDDTGWERLGEMVRRCRKCEKGAWSSPSSVPREFKTSVLENYEALPGNAAALRIAKAFHAGARDLYLWGNVGSGKSRLACSILNEFYQRTTSGQFMRVGSMLLALQPSSDDIKRDAVETVATTSPLLVLDEVGGERDEATDFTRRTLVHIYESRYDRGLQTIWTSNKSLDDLSRFMVDDRLTSRIAGRCDVVELKVPDQRLVRR